MNTIYNQRILDSYREITLGLYIPDYVQNMVI